ncbi:19712_t:CDS:2 [Dentiscutata erythropus]|uniref:19712_t:CDS:1 n=1 Tax=Dentiscutata erythropus TaxID=1348616 RepID=A0A9N9HAL1_9GLOM|nr:19712_t:CDS:2 [Dentiscutata erythropus]
MVGGSGLTFTPQNTTAAPGDTITFMWAGTTPHSVIQSDAPAGNCNKSATLAPYYPVNSVAGFNVTYTVNATPPVIWYFCGVPGHCQGGMWGTIKLATATNGTAGSPTGGATPASSGSPTGGDTGKGGKGGNGGNASPSGTTGTEASGTAKPASSASKGEISGALIIGSGLLMYIAGHLL